MVKRHLPSSFLELELFQPLMLIITRIMLTGMKSLLGWRFNAFKKSTQRHH